MLGENSDWVLPPRGAAIRVCVLAEADGLIDTDFGTFRADTLTWVVDPRYMLVRGAQHELPEPV